MKGFNTHSISMAYENSLSSRQNTPGAPFATKPLLSRCLHNWMDGKTIYKIDTSRCFPSSLDVPIAELDFIYIVDV